MRNIGRDSKIIIYFGGLQDGVPNYGTGSQIQGIARSVDIDDTASDNDLSGLGEARARMRAIKGSTTIEIDQFVDTTWMYADSNGSYLGFYVKLEVYPRSSLATRQIFEGVITRWRYSISAPEQVESIRIMCDADKD